jgi:hypothetical protein
MRATINLVDPRERRRREPRVSEGCGEGVKIGVTHFVAGSRNGRKGRMGGSSAKGGVQAR